MAATAEISPKELKRIAVAAYEGKRIRVSLAAVGTTGYNSESETTDWDSVKISGNGYADFTDVIEVGAYDATDLRYEMGGAVGANTYIDAIFTATGTGYVYDRIYVVIGTSDGSGGWVEETYIHSLITESPSVTLISGQSQTYRIQLVLDD
jgi:hypothetical protein